MDGLYEITNPDTGEKQSLHFSGSLDFTAGICWTNDGRFTTDEINTFMIMTGLCVLISLFLYIVYRVSKNEAEKIIGIH